MRPRPGEPGPYRVTADLAVAEQRRTRRELEQLRETARLCAEEPDARALASLVAERARALVDGTCAMAVWVEVSVPVIVAFAPLDAGEGIPDVDAAGTAAGWVMRFERACYSDEVRVGPSFAAHAPPTSFACVPILNHQHHVVGLIEVHEPRRGGGFTDEQRHALDVLAWQASTAFERARTLDRMHDWTKSLETLLAFTSTISQHASPDIIIRRLVENAVSLLKADAGLAGLALPAQDQESLVMACEAYWVRGRWHDRPRRWGRMEGLPGYVLETEFPYITNDYPADRLADAELVAGPDVPVARALCTPIKGSDESIVGFFELHKAAGQPEFTWQDVAFLESLASMAAVTIQNARLLKIVEDKNEQIRALSVRHLERLEEERTHISRELHDEAGQALIGIKLRLQALSRSLPATLGDTRQQLDALRDEVNASTTLLKNLARRLRPPTLDHFGLDVALRQLAQEFQVHTGISVLLDCPADVPRLASDLTVYRVAQEAMTNAAKHAEPTTVRLWLRLDADTVVLSVSDDGRGFDPTQPTSGLGLVGLLERVAALGGAVELQSVPGQGTIVTASIPR